MTTPQFDADAARAFVAALGKPSAAIRLRGFLPSGHPSKSTDKGRKAAPSRDTIAQWQSQGRGVYIVINDGGDSDAQITACRAVFCEWDNRPKDWQVTAWKELGLPEPSIQVDTGGKSIHNYWVLSELISPDQWRSIQTRLLEHADADRSLKNPSRVMRLPGTHYVTADGTLGPHVAIIHQSDNRYTPADIEACLHSPEQQQQITEANTFTDYTPHCLAEIQEALDHIPSAVPKQNQYPFYRNLLWGLIEACNEAGGSVDDALPMIKRHSPLFAEADQVASSKYTSITAGTFWYWARKHGWKPDRQQRKKRPTQSTVSNDDESTTVPTPVPPPPGGYFSCLGFEGNHYFYLPHSTGQVLTLSGSSHTSTNLCRLAPLEYWETLYQSKSGVNWTAAASNLFAQQAAAGVYSPDRIRGRGAWWDHGRAVIHLGDRLLVNGDHHPISQRLTNSPYLYQRHAAIEGITDLAPLPTPDAQQILLIAERFHWEVPASGLLLAGWATLAPICGALDWRPHVWLTAGAGSGKSAILDRFLGPLLGPLSLWPEGNTTEAFIRQELRADAMPVVFDEAESNEKRDQDRIQSVLALARVSSSSGRGVIGKGSADGTAQRYTIRSMFLMSSIATALKQGADKSRFAQLTLRNPAELPKADRTAHWEALDRDLDRYISNDIGRRLLARTISLIPTIRDSARVFRRVAAEHFDSQRLGDQYGTLLAGAYSLFSTDIPSEDQARKLISDNNWEPYSQATEIPDERRCIQTILQHQLRVEAERSSHTRTIGELVNLALSYEPDPNIPPSLAQATLGRHGVKADDAAVIISNNAQAIAAILRDTSWSNCWPTVLTRLPGATKAGATWFKGAGTTSRAVRVPLASIDTAEP